MKQPRYTVKQIGDGTFVAHDRLQGLNCFQTISPWRGVVEKYCYDHNREWSNELARRPRPIVEPETP